MPSIIRPVTPLRRVLREQGRMQVWLARQTGQHPSEISDYVRGVHVPAQATRARIACVLGVDVNDLWPENPAA